MDNSPKSPVEPPGPPDDHPDATLEHGGGEVLDDGQEEVFAYSAVARGLVIDPPALGPDDIARAQEAPRPQRRAPA